MPKQEDKIHELDKKFHEINELLKEYVLKAFAEFDEELREGVIVAKEHYEELLEEAKEKELDFNQYLEKHMGMKSGDIVKLQKILNKILDKGYETFKLLGDIIAKSRKSLLPLLGAIDPTLKKYLKSQREEKEI